MLDPFFGSALGGNIFAAVQGADACMAPDLAPVPECDLSTGVITDDAAGTIVFQLTRPDPDFIFSLASPTAYPVPASVPLTSAVDDAFPGTGPYVVSFHDDKQVRLTRNPNFTVWNQDARPDGYPDEIDWIVAESAEEAAAMVERGDADYIRLSRVNRPSAETLARIRAQLTGQLHYASNTVTSVTMNAKLTPFDSLDVRKAVNLAIDRPIPGKPARRTVSRINHLPGSATRLARLRAVLPVHDPPRPWRPMAGAQPRRRTRADPVVRQGRREGRGGYQVSIL